MVHEVKSWPRFFTDTLARRKMFEIRLNDRGYSVGDTMRLREWDEVTKQYTGREREVVITYILGADMHCAVSPVAINKPYVVMGISY
jgi:uncharacterized protein DUF3850